MDNDGTYGVTGVSMATALADVEVISHVELTGIALALNLGNEASQADAVVTPTGTSLTGTTATVTTDFTELADFPVDLFTLATDALACPVMAAEEQHYLDIPKGGAWTILLCSRPYHKWGFYVNNHKWRPLRYFHKFGIIQDENYQ